ncbi:hypothetical protein [Paludisphaera borealis]|uniref:Uncharacterized protein n=1 Tax=Paludisphaera borealis TaxID=1387353 RepID=A0A1U7CSD9_9BACT|nr:hypothetical protein [Paludisphaera borealis]APW61852.1 hypothetical protein BSF38_03382 [Paludisphaera borealis]
MNTALNENAWEDRLRAGLGEAPAPDFEAWRIRRAEALDALKPAIVPQTHRYRRILVTSSKWVAAAAIILASGLFLLRPGNSIGRTAFAAAIPGVDDPLTMTWTTTYYARATSVDGKRTWLQEERRLHAYRHPGRYRETFLDKEGQPRMIEITDARTGRMLVLDLKGKKAVLKAAIGQPDVRGPFAWVGEALRDRMVAKVLPVKSVSLQGTREIDGLQANVVRAMIVENEDQGPARRDFLFDRKSKRLAAIYVTNENDFDPETAPERKQTVEEKSSMWMPVARWEHEIVVDPKLDAADFRLDPPAGYAYEAQAKPTITEDEMAGFLGAAARFNGDVFPDSPFAAFDQVKFNAASLKQPAAQTAAEKELIQLHDKYLTREVYQPPARRFVDDQTEPDTFHYVGAGAKVGQADRIVAWYTLKNGLKLRALYADLSVKDVSPADLPLSLPE